MTTNQLNRERLEKIKSWRETYGAGNNVMLPAEEAEELARIALAAMDSEPVAAVPEDVRQALSKMDDEIIAELDAEESACRAAMLAAAPQEPNP